MVVIAIAVKVSSAATFHDFGDVVRGLDYTNSFVLSNETRSTWHVVNVRPLCECVKAAWYDSCIPSGGPGTVALVLETAKLHGKVRYLTLILVTNTMPDNPGLVSSQILQLELRATVVDDISVVPALCNIGTVRTGTKPGPFFIKVASKTGRAIPPPTIGKKPPWISIAVEPGDARSATSQCLVACWTIKLTAAAPPIGLLDELVPFSFAYTNSGRYALRIKGTVEPAFAAQPAILSIGRVATGSTVERTASILPLAGFPVKIDQIRFSGSLVSIASLGTNNPNAATITLLIRPDRPGMIDETVTVVLDNPDQKEVPIRILGNAQ